MVNRTLLLLICFSASAFAQEFKWYGDVRVRAQREKELDREVHNQLRLRARFGVNVKIDDEWRAEIRLATSKSNRSNNQTLGDPSEPGSRRRFIGLDVGYIDYTPASFVHLYGGRFPQVHFRPGESQIILDDDLSLEGAGAKLDYEFYPNVSVYLSGGSTYIRENYDNYYAQDLSDNMLNFGQLGVRWKQDGYELNVGSGFYNFTSVQGKKFGDLAVGGKSDGNSEGLSGEVKYPYLPKQFYIDFKFPLSSLKTSVFGEYIENGEGGDLNHAWWTGFSLGQNSWDMQLGATQVDSDAVMAMFTHSDFGNGKTDVRGYIGSVRWKFMRNVSLKLVQFYGWNNMHLAPVEYDRTHVDLTASF